MLWANTKYLDSRAAALQLVQPLRKFATCDNGNKLFSNIIATARLHQEMSVVSYGNNNWRLEKTKYKPTTPPYTFFNFSRILFATNNFNRKKLSTQNFIYCPIKICPAGAKKRSGKSDFINSKTSLPKILFYC